MNEGSMTQHSKADLLRRYFAAFMSSDRKVMEAGLADDFTFTSPYDDAIDKATYFVRCWPNSERIRSFDLETIIEAGEEAFVRYRAITKDGREFRNTEFFTFRGEQIASVEVYFGADYRDGKFVQKESS
jgi:ketosteroid isomerase-like protein